ncbi:MAG: hypothetical protein EXX96DRAFT_588442 [Benjaminiella poitrasii]|nr:MAG: hypothetical protein EXX96DRAFT_588442 [Benjaminiella poitrasii]
MASRSLFLFALLFTAMVCLTMAKPTKSSSSATKTKKSKETFTLNGDYQLDGLPADIFPDFSTIIATHTDELKDAQKFLKKQGEGKKLEGEA